MTILELITNILKRANTEVGDLKAALEAAKAAKPDLAPVIDPILAALNMPVDLGGVTTAIIPELGAIAMFKLNGREHPSDGF